jgi:hypothetical protein
MDLAIIMGITIFFGIAALSTIAQRNGPPVAPVIVVRAEQIRDRSGEQSDGGFGIFLLFAAIVAAVYLL